MRAFALVVLALGLAGCGAAESRDVTTRTTTSDSAGVTIVHNDGSDRPLEWDRTSGMTALDADGSPYIFTNLSAQTVRTAADGGFYAVSPQDAVVLRFDAAGRLQRQLGRRGRGPGEFQLPQAVRRQGDTVFVFDPMRLAVVRFHDADGAELPEIRVRTEDQGVQPLHLRADSIFGVRRNEGGDSVVVAVGVSEESRSTFTTSEARGVPINLPCLPIAVRRTPLLSPSLRWDAKGLSTVLSAGGEYVLWILEGDRITRSVRRMVPARPADKSALTAAAGRGVRASLGGSACSIDAEKLAEDLGSAPTVPPVNGVALMEDGSVFVLRTVPGEERAVVDYFDGSGAYTGTLVETALPVGRLPDGRFLVPVSDDDSGGYLLTAKALAPL